MFTLCVDGFGIEVNSMQDAHHLINAINKYFKCSIDWEGQNYVGLTLDWKYNKKYVDIYMPENIPTALQKFQHKPPARDKYSPHTWDKLVYRKYIQLSTQQSSAPDPNSVDTNSVQSINRTFLYYSQAVEPTMLPDLKNIPTFQKSIQKW